MNGADFLQGVDGKLHEELRIIAKRLMKGERCVTVSPTSLVHDALLACQKVERASELEPSDIKRLCAKIMWQLIVDAARRRKLREMGSVSRFLGIQDDRADVLVIEDLMEAIAKEKPRTAEILRMKTVGYKNVDIAEALGLGVRTVQDSVADAAVFFRLKGLNVGRQEGGPVS